MAHSACKFLFWGNVLRFPIQIIPHGGNEVVKIYPPRKIKIKASCLRTILRDMSQTISSSPLRCFSPTLNLTYVP